MANMITTENVRFEYGTNSGSAKPALDDININIAKGEFVAILGHNGSGKSTLAKHFNALLLPGAGTVYVKEMNTKNEKLLWDIRQTAGMVFQNPDNQIVATIVEEDVAFGPENLGIPPLEIRRRVDDSIKTVDMTEYAKHSPHLLSGGQKQRVAIAGIIAMKPECIILDEPTALLDPVGRKEVLNTIIKLNKEEGITIILITHYMDEAIQADRIYVMKNGKIIMEGKPKDVFKEVETVKAAGLDVPQVTELSHRLNREGLQLSPDILTVEEMVVELCRLK
ncbi:MAG TPA: energy-coupling factor transporter ATPase [Bacillota bacterium]|nr:energy-coupling factor transporter ATPase [Clostridiaceae bacterium]HNR03546.1 energy-coupling factor transporter ATPase [Bacillota bacterium]HNT02710.1 energy-coupling factor transporter ATPase [Bacillota bacterium]HPX68047.1 energy-coupling factor transporter ATPase [Bacillota bacterium]HQA64426.1 energy-coupling factor transporter ATPase [Bacillota bacterium]